MHPILKFSTFAQSSQNKICQIYVSFSGVASCIPRMHTHSTDCAQKSVLASSNLTKRARLFARNRSNVAMSGETCTKFMLSCSPYSTKIRDFSFFLNIFLFYFFKTCFNNQANQLVLMKSTNISHIF